MPYAHVFSAFAVHLQAFITHGGYAVLFIFTLLEGLPLIGMAVPGHVAILIAGFLARVGTLNVWLVLAISIIGAVAGDYAGFAIGRKYGLGFIDRLRPYFFISDDQIAKTRDLLNRHTGKAMVIGRFTPATRALMPFLVGAGETSAGKFWAFNLIGGVSWAVVSVMIGYIFGAGYHAAAGYLGRLIVVAIIFAALAIWGYRFVNMRFHVFRKYELFALALNLVALFVLARMIQDAFAAQSFMASFDVYVSSRIVDPATQTVLIPYWLAVAAYWVTTIGGFAVTMTAGTLTGVWLLIRKRLRSAAIMLLAVFSTALALGTLKEFFMRARPDYAVTALLHFPGIVLEDPSFPSGHAAMAAAFFTALAYLFAPRLKTWVRRELFILFSVLAILAVGISRILLNVHWVSDVIAGWALGVFIATAWILLVKYIGTLFMRKTGN